MLDGIFQHIRKTSNNYEIITKKGRSELMLLLPWIEAPYTIAITER